jgi:hypothetical protein
MIAISGKREAPPNRNGLFWHIAYVWLLVTPMAMSPAEKMRQHRARRAEGKVLLTVAIEEDSLIDALIESGELNPSLAGDKATMSEVLAAILWENQR